MSFQDPLHPIFWKDIEVRYFFFCAFCYKILIDFTGIETPLIQMAFATRPNATKII